MNNIHILRLAIIVEASTFVISLLLGLLLELPAELADYSPEWLVDAEGGTLALLGIYALFAIAALIASWIGLYKQRRWAWWLYLATSAVTLLTMPIFGHDVNHALIGPIDVVSSAAMGVILVAGFFATQPRLHQS